MKICISIFRHVIVDNDVDALDIDSTTNKVSRDKDTLVALLECLVTGQPETCCQQCQLSVQLHDSQRNIHKLATKRTSLPATFQSGYK